MEEVKASILALSEMLKEGLQMEGKGCQMQSYIYIMKWKELEIICTWVNIIFASSISLKDNWNKSKEL